MLKIQTSELFPGDFIVDGNSLMYEPGSLVISITFNHDRNSSINFLLLHNGALVQLQRRAGMATVIIVRDE
jgi:hypothetical protein